MPFPNTLCQGVMSGTSIYRLFQYSISAATFEGILNTTGHEEGIGGDRLLQVSGIRVTYNTQLPYQQRIVQLELIQEEDATATTTNHTTTSIYEPIQQETLYSFVTDSYICDAFTPYPSLVGLKELNLQIGEIPGTIVSSSSDDDDDDMIIQTVVADYLSYLHRNGSSRIYIAEIKGRLVNNTNIMDGLDWLTSTQPSNIPSSTPSSSIHPSWNPSSGPTISATPTLLPSSAPRGSSAAPSSIPSLTPSSLPTTSSRQPQTAEENKNEIPTLSPQSSILPSSQPSSSPSSIPSTGTSKMVTSASSTTPSSSPASPTLLPLSSPSSNAPFQSCRVTYLCLLLGMLIVVNFM